MSLNGHSHLLAPPDGQGLELQLSSMDHKEGQVYRGEILEKIPKQGRIFLPSYSQVVFLSRINSALLSQTIREEFQGNIPHRWSLEPAL